MRIFRATRRGLYPKPCLSGKPGVISAAE